MRQVPASAVFLVIVSMITLSYKACKSIRDDDRTYAICSCFSDSAYIDVINEYNHKYAFLSIKEPIKPDTILHDSFFLRLNSNRIKEIYERHINRYLKNSSLAKMFYRATYTQDTTLSKKAYFPRYNVPLSVNERKLFLYGLDTSFDMYKDTFMLYTMDKKFICFKDGYIKLNDMAINKTKYIYP